MKPLVSIIVPIYNSDNYLDRCLKSILCQTYINLEIILINDGSTDTSLNICKEYIEKDSRVILIDKINEGVSIARNTGIQKSTGDYIAFLDADDWIAPNYIEHLMMPFDNENVDISICEYHICQEYNTSSTELNHGYQFRNAREYLLESRRSGDFAVIVPWGKIFKKSVIKGTFFPPRLHFEDEATIYKFFYAANQIAKSNYKAYYYYQSSKGLTKSVYPQHPEDAVEAFETQYMFFNEKKDVVFYQQTLAILLWKCLTLYVFGKSKKSFAKKKINRYLKLFNQFNVDYNHSISLNFFCRFPFIYLLYKKLF